MTGTPGATAPELDNAGSSRQNTQLDQMLGGNGDVKAESYHTLGQLNMQRAEALAELRKLFEALPARGRDLDKQLQEAEDAQDEEAITRVRTEMEQVQEAWIIAREELKANGEDIDGAETDGAPASAEREPGGSPARAGGSPDINDGGDRGADHSGGTPPEPGDLPGSDPGVDRGPGADPSGAQRDREAPGAGVIPA
jgi:hypothetical protein